MDIFKFAPITNDIDLRNGELVHGIKTVMWIERYREAGEFTITANVSSGIRDALPIGTFISHIKTPEVMVVENHEISDQKTDDLEVTITGRSFETILEQRIVGANKTFPAGEPTNVVLAANTSWRQAETLISLHIETGQVVDPADVLKNVYPMATVNNSTGASVAREVPFGTVYDAVIDILAEDNIGISTSRPTGGSAVTWIFIHDGVDRRNQVVFSFDAGDITNADYLWSNKSSKNSILVTSNWSQVMVKAGAGYSRRVTIIDASDIDEHIKDPPDQTVRWQIENNLTNRGYAVLKSMNQISLSKAQAAKNSKKYVYRKHFNVGDIVLIDGLFNESASMRVTEYVEIFDKDGSSQYPTLSTWPEVS
jgi:hypothetical protein